MLIVRATRKLFDRIGSPDLGEGERSTTLLGQWCAIAVFWEPQVVLFVNEPALLPVLVPMAPAGTLLDGFAEQAAAEQAAAVPAAHGAPETVIAEELRRMGDRRLAKTADRSVVGIMNEFTRLAETYRGDVPAPDLLRLAMRLATTPCSPLYGRHVSPDRELDALLRSVAPPSFQDGGTVPNPVGGTRHSLAASPPHSATGGLGRAAVYQGGASSSFGDSVPTDSSRGRGLRACRWR